MPGVALTALFLLPLVPPLEPHGSGPGEVRVLMP
jgi:hypothetical protein